MSTGNEGIKWEICENEDFVFLELRRSGDLNLKSGSEIERGIIYELKEKLISKFNVGKGVILGGRLPIWFYLKLYQIYESYLKPHFIFFAEYDPRVGGVIIESRKSEFKELDVIDNNIIRGSNIVSKERRGDEMSDSKREDDVNFNLLNIGGCFQILKVITSYISPERLKSKLSRLQELKFDNSKGVVISGKGSIWLYLMVYKFLLKQRVAFIAADTACELPVMISEKKNEWEKVFLRDWKLYLESLEEVKDQRTIALFGPPHSGKSVFVGGLGKKLSYLLKGNYAENVYMVRACPDGEGDWSMEADKNIVESIRIKGGFSDEFVEQVIERIDYCKKRKKLVFVDCGGKPDHYNEKIANSCTDVIIVTGDKQKLQDWYKIIPSNINILAEVYSVLSGEVGKGVDYNGGIMRFTMKGLERGNEGHLEFPEEFLKVFVDLLSC